MEAFKITNPEKPNINELDAAVKKFADISKKLEEVIPEERNFDVEIQEGEKGVTIILHNKETGELKNLNDFLPPNVFFRKGDRYYYKSGTEASVFFPEDSVKFRGFAISLFHEIGHAHQKIEHQVVSADDKIKAGIQRLLKLLRSLSIKVEVKKKDGGTKISFKIGSLSAEQTIPLWFVDKQASLSSKSERNAWAFSLNSLRKLEKEGYKIFAGFDSLEDIKLYIDMCLMTYEVGFKAQRYISRGVDAPTEEKDYIFIRNKVSPKVAHSSQDTTQPKTP